MTTRRRARRPFCEMTPPLRGRGLFVKAGSCFRTNPNSCVATHEWGTRRIDVLFV